MLELLGNVEVAEALALRVGEVVAQASANTSASSRNTSAISSRKANASPQLSLFTEHVEHPVVAQLRSVDLNTLTPLAAFDLLRTLAAQTR